LIGVHIKPLDHYFGPSRNDTGIDRIEGQWDLAAYELAHFIHLLSKGNPNVLSLLFQDDYIIEKWPATRLRLNRELFWSRNAANAFMGYAIGQATRMQKIASGERYSTGFMGEQRKALAAKHGYDPKNAAHAVRIMRMGTEYMQTKKITVNRKGLDADELIFLKQGGRGVEAMKTLIEQESESLAKAIERADPPAPNMALIKHLSTEILSEHFDVHGQWNMGSILNA
jgi:uncharacterized protein